MLLLLLLAHCILVLDVWLSCVYQSGGLCWYAGSIAFALLADGRSARAAGCGAAFLDGGCGYDLGKIPKPSSSSFCGEMHMRL